MKGLDMIRQIVLFQGQTAADGLGLWETNGTVAGTYELTGISGADAYGLQPNGFTVFNGAVLFVGYDSNAVYGLWETNGTAAGTYELTGISGRWTQGQGFHPTDLTVFNGEVLFTGDDASGNYGLWVTNGTAAGTQELTGISGANATGLNAYGFTLFNGEVLFTGDDASGNYGLWVTNGTAAGTQELTGISGVSTQGQGLHPTDLTVFNSEVLFNGEDANGANGLWVTNGTAAGTQELTGISGFLGFNPGLNPYGFTVFNGEILFTGKWATLRCG
jgi:ELWxxDGT repeat protein